jgi:hypothetical protein
MRQSGAQSAFDKVLADLPPALRWRERMPRNLGFDFSL